LKTLTEILDFYNFSDVDRVALQATHYSAVYPILFLWEITGLYIMLLINPTYLLVTEIIWLF